MSILAIGVIAVDTSLIHIIVLFPVKLSIEKYSTVYFFTDLTIIRIVT